MTLKFSPLTVRQKELLEDIRGLLERVRLLPFSPHKTDVDVRKQMLAELDELTYRALRSGLVRIFLGEKEYLIPLDRKDAQGNSICLRLVTGPRRHPNPQSFQKKRPTAWMEDNTTPAWVCSFHPELPDWALEYFSVIVESYRATGQRGYLIRCGLGEGVSKPIKIGRDKDLFKKVLELREVKQALSDSEEIGFDLTGASGEAGSVHQILKELRQRGRIRSPRKLERQGLELKRQLELRKSRQKTKRARKENKPWHMVIRQLVQEGLLSGPISHQALKKKLTKKFPWFNWSEI